jgi:hypothetical protein
MATANAVSPNYVAVVGEIHQGVDGSPGRRADTKS